MNRPMTSYSPSSKCEKSWLNVYESAVPPTFKDDKTETVYDLLIFYIVRGRKKPLYVTQEKEGVRIPSPKPC